jgi:tripartite-type tricarboxylate transporter receptor subunit TctC
MQVTRRIALTGISVPIAMSFGLGAAFAKYPDHPVNFIVPWGPGGGADLLARTTGKIMSQDLGASFPVLNVPGATGMTGMIKLLNSPADGYTLAVLIGDTYSLLSGPHPQFTENQVVPLAIMIQQPSGYYVNVNSPWKTWPDVVKTAKERSLKVATLGFGSADDITTTYLKNKFGLKFDEIPFSKPGLRYTSILGGNADLLYEQTGDVRSYIDGGKIRPLVFFYPHRLDIPRFKDVPIGKEFGYDITLPQFRSIVVKAGTPSDTVKQLADELQKVAATAEFKSYLVNQYADPNSYVPMDGARKFMDDWLSEAKKFRAEAGMGSN